MEEVYSKLEEAAASGLEHLRPDVKPIMACVGSEKELANIEDLPDNIDFVNFDDVDPEKMRRLGYKMGGIHSYIISPIDRKSKFSKRYADCTGLVVAGSEADTGKNISTMSHQNPTYFLKGSREAFLSDLAERLQEVKRRCTERTIDAVIFGGRYAKARELEDGNPQRQQFMKEYEDSIRLLSEQVHAELGFYPTVVVGPKTNPDTDDAVYNNEERRLYVKRKSDTDGFIQSFNSKDLDSAKGAWKPGEWSLPF